jgi:hypothetical protein
VHALLGRRAVAAMVPVLDMIDHSPDMEAVWHTGPAGTDDFTFAPLVPVPKVRPLHRAFISGGLTVL